MARPVTADLRNIEDDGNRWWAVTGNVYGTPWFYPAPSGRQAVAQHRREVIEAERLNGWSGRDAVRIVQALKLAYRGPYTAREAFVLDVGWQLAQAECESYGGLALVAGGPIDDLDQCKPMLTDHRIEAILDMVARHYPHARRQHSRAAATASTPTN